jgi:hypothetical protein
MIGGMKKLIPLIALAGCAVPGPDARYEAEYAVESAWYDAGLDIPYPECNVESFRVIHATVTEYWALCHGDPAKSYGCSTDEHVGGPLSGQTRPVVVVAPWWHIEPSIVVHEILHAFQRCTDGRDPAHADPRVWSAAGGATSVQSVAMAAL